jgi:hypothetical protein
VYNFIFAFCMRLSNWCVTFCLYLCDGIATDVETILSNQLLPKKSIPGYEDLEIWPSKWPDLTESNGRGQVGSTRMTKSANYHTMTKDKVTALSSLFPFNKTIDHYIGSQYKDMRISRLVIRKCFIHIQGRGRRGRDGMVVESTTICDTVCQLPAIGRWFAHWPIEKNEMATD